MEQTTAPLKGKVAIVTGGSRGLGAGIALKLAQKGCTHIAITYSTNKKSAEEVASSIKQVSPNIVTTAFAADLLLEDFGSHVVNNALSGLATDHIDIVVSNAAFTDASKSPDPATITLKQFTDYMTANAWASLSLARAAVLKMPPGGRIITISSFTSRLAWGEGMVSYSASKAALECITKNLAAEWGDKYSVTVNSISVGVTKTETGRKNLELLGLSAEEATLGALLKRAGEVEEVANIVAFVAGPEAGWITGNCIPANGGALAMVQ